MFNDDDLEPVPLEDGHSPERHRWPPPRSWAWDEVDTDLFPRPVAVVVQDDTGMEPVRLNPTVEELLERLRRRGSRS